MQKLAKDANIDYAVFMRTTEPRHRVAVEHVWVSYTTFPTRASEPHTLDTSSELMRCWRAERARQEGFDLQVELCGLVRRLG